MKILMRVSVYLGVIYAAIVTAITYFQTDLIFPRRSGVFEERPSMKALGADEGKQSSSILGGHIG